MSCPQSCTRFSAQRVLLGGVTFFSLPRFGNFQTKGQILGLYTVSTKANKSEVVTKVLLNQGQGAGCHSYYVHLLQTPNFSCPPTGPLPLQLPLALGPWPWPLAPTGPTGTTGAPLELPQLATGFTSHWTHQRLVSLFTISWIDLKCLQQIIVAEMF